MTYDRIEAKPIPGEICRFCSDDSAPLVNSRGRGVRETCRRPDEYAARLSRRNLRMAGWSVHIRPLCYLESDHPSRRYPQAGFTLLREKVSSVFPGSESDQKQSQSATDKWHLIACVIECAFTWENKQLPELRVRAGVRRNATKRRAFPVNLTH